MRTVSIVSCCRNERLTIELFLASLNSQVYSGLKLHVVIADGQSADGTRATLDRFAATRPSVQIIGNPGRIASTGLNAAIHASNGSIVIRMDAHTCYAPDYVQTCVDVLDAKQAAAVGGPMRLAHGTYWQNALGLAYPSRLFAGGSRVYDAKYNGPVDSVLYGCWPRSVLETSGGFDEQLVRNQDDELAYRIRKAGGLIWQDSRIHCWYYPRRSPLALAKQFFGYGFWKVRVMRKHRTVMRFRHIVPAIAAAGFTVATVAAVWSRNARRIWSAGSQLYGLAVLAASLARVRHPKQLIFIPAAALAFPVAHFGYGAGTLAALARDRR